VLTVADYVDGVRAGDRTILSRAITLVESKRPDHFDLAQEVLEQLLPETGKAHRIGITGVPGVGKSTFIEKFGGTLTAEGKKVAVLAVDPTSSRTGGSILGDKTRMATLAIDPNAFIRPSPSGGYLGGVNRMTRETMLLCEAAGFDVILVETVGAGQSETMVADMTDFFLVLMLPGAGDELQGIKKGVLEIADMIAVNKMDADPIKAKMAAREYRSALRIMTPQHPDWEPPVEMVSGLSGQGLGDLWAQLQNHHRIMTENGGLAEKRRVQQHDWMWSMLKDRLIETFTQRADISDRLAALEAQVKTGAVNPSRAVAELISKL
jgi:LAO/AO transport system kinase